MVTVVTSLLSWLTFSPLPPFICKMSPDVCLKTLFFITTSPHITGFVVCLRWNSCGSSMTPSQVKKDILPQNVSSKSTQTSVPLSCCFCTDLFSVLLCFFHLPSLRHLSLTEKMGSHPGSHHVNQHSASHPEDIRTTCLTFPPHRDESTQLISETVF